jgi:hypothetical protein
VTEPGLADDGGLNPMQRLSALVRYIFTAILVPIIVAVAIHYIEQQPTNVVLKFLFDLSEQTWLRVTALLLGGFVAGLWVDWLLRKLDGSRAKERQALGVEMRILAYDLPRLGLHQLRPQIMSCLTTARKLGIWTPDDRIFSIHPLHATDLITDYLMHVGTMLMDGHFSEAKQYALNSKANFNKALHSR